MLLLKDLCFKLQHRDSSLKNARDMWGGGKLINIRVRAGGAGMAVNFLQRQKC